MIEEVAATKGYLSSSDPRPQFGLGAATRADSVEVRWPSGKVQTLTDVAANQILVMTEPRAVAGEHSPAPASPVTAKGEPSVASGRRTFGAAP
jgi:hypothetical protein